MARIASGVGLIPEQDWELPDLAASPFGTDPTRRVDRLRERQAGRLGGAADLVGGVVRAARRRPRRRATRSTGRGDTVDRYVDAHPGRDDADGDEPGRQRRDRRLAGRPSRGTTAPGNTVDVARRRTSTRTRHDDRVDDRGAGRLVQRRRAGHRRDDACSTSSPSSPSGATAHAKRTVVFDFVAGHAAARRRPTRTATTTGRATTPTRPRATSTRARSTCSASRSSTRAERHLPRADARPDADVRQPARRAARRRLRARSRRATPTSTAAASSRDAQLHDRAGRRVEPADRGAGLRPALRSTRSGATLGTVGDHGQRDLALHHVHASRRPRSAQPGPGWALHRRPHRPGRLQRRPGARLPADAAGLPVRRLRDRERRPALHRRPGTRAEGDRRDHAGRRRSQSDRARLHAAAPVVLRGVAIPDAEPARAARCYQSVGR